MSNIDPETAKDFYRNWGASRLRSAKPVDVKRCFEDFFMMVDALRQRHDEELRQLTAALKAAEAQGASQELQVMLQTLEARLKAKFE